MSTGTASFVAAERSGASERGEAQRHVPTSTPAEVEAATTGSPLERPLSRGPAPARGSGAARSLVAWHGLGAARALRRRGMFWSRRYSREVVSSSANLQPEILSDRPPAV